MKNAVLVWANAACFCLLAGPALAQSTAIFPPQTPPKQVQAAEISESLTLDGKLDEGAWRLAAPTSGFFQAQPEQGKPLTFDTQVRVVYNRKFLYVGAFCPDSLGRRGVRVPDLRRDFEYFQNDLFGVSLDPFLDRRNAQAFQTNPFGAQRDVLCFDDAFFDRDWDGFWNVRTSRTDSGWVAELQLPWVTLRYPRADSLTTWGVNFVRIARRLNEQAYWSPVPQAYSVYRMPYAGLLTGLRPPPPSANVRVQPYLLTEYGRQRANRETLAETTKPKLGGEVKWALSPGTVLDLTANTDFAQADADRQIQNLTRFSIFFPERRQFFLENASLFAIGDVNTSSGANSVMPFFSRRIGLSSPEAGGLPLPIDFGARLVSRTPRHSVGGLVVRQRGLNRLPDTWFAVGRFSQNFGEQNRLGGLVTARYDLGRDSLRPVTNYTGSVDGFWRISQPLNYYAMLSYSTTPGATTGWSAVSKLTYQTNRWYLFLWNSLVTKTYDPGVGFVYGTNVLFTNLGGFRIFRPAWRPRWLRQLDPGFFLNLYHRASDGRFQQGEIEAFPLYLVGVKGVNVYAYVVPTWQRLDEPFRPLGIAIRPGDYFYTRYRFRYASDPSAKAALALFYETGRYYDGRLNTFTATLRYSPLPQASLALDYTRNEALGLGAERQHRTAHLLTPQVRLALNPRLQLIGFYQKNTAAERDVYNLRLAWEFQPLSFVYLVYNSSVQQVGTDRLRAEQAIGKLTYLKQF